jgi:ribosomal protein S18 acetylase RimI-like enzyme
MLIPYNALAIKDKENNIISAILYGTIKELKKEGIILLATKKEYRGKGYASMLINKYIENTSDITEYYLICRSKNKTAINTYTKLGWSLHNTIPDYYWGPTDDAIVYEYINKNNVR